MAIGKHLRSTSSLQRLRQSVWHRVVTAQLSSLAMHPDEERYGANTDQVNAMLIKPEQSSARPAMVTARKLLEANSSRMAHLD
jgi:hypothetical protein